MNLSRLAANTWLRTLLFGTVADSTRADGKCEYQNNSPDYSSKLLCTVVQATFYLSAAVRPLPLRSRFTAECEEKISGETGEDGINGRLESSNGNQLGSPGDSETDLLWNRLPSFSKDIGPLQVLEVSIIYRISPLVRIASCRPSVSKKGIHQTARQADA